MLPRSRSKAGSRAAASWRSRLPIAGLALGLLVSGCSVLGQTEDASAPRTEGADQDAVTVQVEPAAPPAAVEQRSAKVKVDAESKRKLKKIKASKKDPFALSRAMRKIRERERLAAEAKAARERAAAEKAAEEAEAARKAELKAARLAAKERSRGGLVIGDSVALGAEPCLAQDGFEVNAVQSRSFNAGFAALREIPRTSLPETVVIHLGTNGPFSTSDFQAVMEHLGSQHHVVWVTIALPDLDLYSFEGSLNYMIKDLASNYENVSVADWNAVSEGKSSWFYKDQIHISAAGCQGFASVVNAAARS